MLVVAAATGMLGFALGLRFGVFSLMVATLAVTFGTGVALTFVNGWSVGWLLAAMGLAALSFEIAAFASMTVISALRATPAAPPATEASPQAGRLARH